MMEIYQLYTLDASYISHLTSSILFDRAIPPCVYSGRQGLLFTSFSSIPGFKILANGYTVYYVGKKKKKKNKGL